MINLVPDSGGQPCGPFSRGKRATWWIEARSPVSFGRILKTLGIRQNPSDISPSSFLMKTIDKWDLRLCANISPRRQVKRWQCDYWWSGYFHREIKSTETLFVRRSVETLKKQRAHSHTRIHKYTNTHWRSAEALKRWRSNARARILIGELVEALAVGTN